jgi:hypothetical protein
MARLSTVHGIGWPILVERAIERPRAVGLDDTISTAALVRDVILDTSKHSIEATPLAFVNAKI